MSPSREDLGAGFVGSSGDGGDGKPDETTMCPECEGLDGHHLMGCGQLVVQQEASDDARCPACGATTGEHVDVGEEERESLSEESEVVEVTSKIPSSVAVAVDPAVDQLSRKLSQEKIQEHFDTADKLFGDKKFEDGAVVEESEVGEEGRVAESREDILRAPKPSIAEIEKKIDAGEDVHLSPDGTLEEFDEQKLPPTGDDIVSNEFTWLVAKVCHEVNRVYCQSIGDWVQVVWDAAPEYQRESCYNGVVMHFENPGATPIDSHRSWLAEKEKAGWRYGPVKSEEERTHPCMVPYNQLAPAQKYKDVLFGTICRAMFGGEGV